MINTQYIYKYYHYNPFDLELYIVKSVTQDGTRKQSCMGHLKGRRIWQENNPTLTLIMRKIFLIIFLFWKKWRHYSGGMSYEKQSNRKMSRIYPLFKSTGLRKKFIDGRIWHEILHRHPKVNYREPNMNNKFKKEKELYMSPQWSEGRVSGSASAFVLGVPPPCLHISLFAPQMINNNYIK